MISAFRRSLDTWPVRGFFLIMVAAFIVWGIGDVFRLVGTVAPGWPRWAARPSRCRPAQQAYQQQIADVQRRLPAGTDATPDLRAPSATRRCSG